MELTGVKQIDSFDAKRVFIRNSTRLAYDTGKGFKTWQARYRTRRCHYQWHHLRH